MALLSGARVRHIQVPDSRGTLACLVGEGWGYVVWEIGHARPHELVRLDWLTSL